MAKLSKADITKITAAQERVLFYGTPEKGYADSGLWEFLSYCYTKDSHDSDNPVKKLLGPNDAYAIVVFLHMLACNDLAIPKSRQIRMSWFSCTFGVWSAMSAPYRHVIYQTKKEEDAFAQTTQGSKNPADGRMDFIIQHLPSWLRDPHIISGKGNLMGTLMFSSAESYDGIPNPCRGSKINAIPQGGNQVRQYTPSLIISDESAFQDEYAASRIAAKPAVTGGGKFISVSSVDNGSAFNQTVLDIDGEIEHKVNDVVALGLKNIGIEWPKGLRSWKTRANVDVLEVHYSADPKKDPDREGAKWVDEAVRGYVGGTESSGWQTEMEINYGAGGGDPVFPQVKIGTPIFIDSFQPHTIMDKMRFYAGYDYGARNPSAFVVWGIDKDNKAYAVWELYEPCTNISAHVEKIKRCPYWDRIEVIVCDPSIMSKTQQGAADIKTLGEIFEEHGLSLTRGRRGQDVSIAQLFNADYWADPQNPDAFITKSCPSGMGEITDLRWAKHVSEALNVRKNAPESIRDKNNHWWDATATLFDYGVQPFVPEIIKPTAGTYAQAVADLRLITARERTRKGGIHVV